MKRQSYKNVYGKPIVKYVRNMPNLPGGSSFASLTKQDEGETVFNRVLKVTETPPRMGEQRFMAKQKIGRGLRMM